MARPPGMVWEILFRSWELRKVREAWVVAGSHRRAIGVRDFGDGGIIFLFLLFFPRL